MRRHFFITGRPRSRTAWLANYLTHGDTFCFHDAFRALTSPQQLAELFDRVPTPAVGHADPANLFFLEALMRQWPLAQWVLIDRDPEEVAADAAQAFGPQAAGGLERYDRQIAHLKHLQGDDLLIVPFSQIDQMAPAIAQACNPRWHCHPARHALLTHLQVMIEPRQLSAEIAAGISPQLLSHVEA